MIFPCLTLIDLNVIDSSLTPKEKTFFRLLAFKIAGSMAIKEACKRAKPILLEPVMKVEVVLPEQYLGDVMGDLTSRRSEIQGTDHRKDAVVIKAITPLSEMFGYATSLRSMTQGRAVFSMEFDNYKKAPKSVTEGIIEKSGLVSEPA